MIDPIAIPNLFGIEGLNIHWYALIICLGIICGTAVAVYHARKRGFNSDLVVDMLICAIILAIIGARAYYVVFEWDYYAKNPADIIAIWKGGLAFYGGLIGGSIGFYIFSKHSKVQFLSILDIAAPGVILGQAIGRWGNFVNQEAFGELVTDERFFGLPFSVYIEDLGEYHMATFFYESMWNLMVLVLLVMYFKKAKQPGNVFAMYLIGYGTGRAIIEGLRTDSLWLIPDVIRVSQLLSIIFVIAGALFIILRHNKEPMFVEYYGKYSIGYKENKPENDGENRNGDESQESD